MVRSEYDKEVLLEAILCRSRGTQADFACVDEADFYKDYREMFEELVIEYLGNVLYDGRHNLKHLQSRTKELIDEWLAEQVSHAVNHPEDFKYEE